MLSTQVFHMFDQLCVVEEGNCLYFGPTRGASAVFGKVCAIRCLNAVCSCVHVLNVMFLYAWMHTLR